MFVPSKELKALIDTFPTRKLFAEKVGMEESYLSRVLDGEREISKTGMEALVKFTGWPLDDLFDVREDK